MHVEEAALGDAGALAELMAQLGYSTMRDEMAARVQRILGDADCATLVAGEDWLRSRDVSVALLTSGAARAS
ncbi:MAG: hypothetical protein ACRDHE_00300 [Ktedonobacterales bacterium]